MYSRDKSYLSGKGTDLVHTSTVNALLVNKEPAANDLLLYLVDELGKDYLDILVLFLEGSNDIVHDGLHLCVSDVLVIGVKSLHNTALAVCEDLIEHIVIKLAGCVLELRLADLAYDIINEGNDAAALLVRDHDSLVHSLVGDLVSACLDHNDLSLGCRNGKLEVALCSLFCGGVYDDLAVNKTHENACDRTVPGNIRDGKGDGRTDHSGDLGRTVGIYGHDSEKKRDVVTKILGEEGTDGTVNNTSCKNCLLGGLTLTLEEATGDLAYCVHLLVVINRQRKEVDALAGSCGCGCGCEHGSLTVLNECRTVCKTCDLACLDYKGSACKLILVLFVVVKGFEDQELESYSVYMDARTGEIIKSYGPGEGNG